ncbi:Receptor-like protein 30 [Cardamine amara subsp. amara]|uniref:Receptor-like protein 30 n=1 Tax=Cardamine amara subsp. amara TaxID=228776 RepID=A0ABD1AYA1_CARAN
MMIPNQSNCFSGIVTLYFFFVLHTLASPTLHYCRHDQRDALVEFKHEFPVNESNLSVNDTMLNLWLSSWNKSNDCCSWEGVTCDAKSGDVISLFMDFIPLNNSLKPNSGLFKLQHLQNLSLYNCNLYGEIPSSLGNLSRLTELVLSYNQFVGQVPSSISNLTRLRELRLDYNNFIGNIPVSFANLTKLSKLFLTNNYFESMLSLDVSGLHNLEFFEVSENSIVGPIPTSLFTISSLQMVSLRRNQFKGPIEFGGNTSSSSRLSTLLLGDNHFDGPIPESLSNLLSLQMLDLGYNNFIGPTPRSISKLVNLYYLNLSNNKLEGQAPGCLWGMMSAIRSHNSFSSFEKPVRILDEIPMQMLAFNSISFRGPFPSWICKLRWVILLDLSNNSLSGSIPQCLWNSTTTLGALVLHNNNFSGILPDIFFNATRLKALDVSSNQFEGKLPKSLINCTSIQLLNAQGNRIKDEFPSWLGSLPSLHVLILRSNQFYGPLYHNNVSIGFQSLRVIDVSHNHFTGAFPPFYFSNWLGMITVNGEEEDTYMEGLTVGPLEILYRLNRNSMEMVQKGVNTDFERIRSDFVAIDFSGNRFCGKIPDSIGLLKELRLLNLSGNTFTGNIPQSLVNLTTLEQLDISQNQLSGQIPQDLANLSFLSTMNFSYNNLQGPIPRGTQFQRQSCSSFMYNPKLYGLEEICGGTHVSNPTTPQESEDLSEDPEEQVINWIAAAIAYGPGVFCGLVIGHIFASHKHHRWFTKFFYGNKPEAVTKVLV